MLRRRPVACCFVSILIISGLSGCLSNAEDVEEARFVQIEFVDSERSNIRLGEQLEIEVSFQSSTEFALDLHELNWTLSSINPHSGEIVSTSQRTNVSSTVIQPTFVGKWIVSVVAEVNSSAISDRISKEIITLPYDFVVIVNSACKADEDLDGDGVNNIVDDCSMGTINWNATFSLDHDSDGCFDGDEDLDDDNDGKNDSLDRCPIGYLNWIGSSLTDYDNDGCFDLTEDNDDDDDGVSDKFDDYPRDSTRWFGASYYTIIAIGIVITLYKFRPTKTGDNAVNFNINEKSSEEFGFQSEREN